MFKTEIKNLSLLDKIGFMTNWIIKFWSLVLLVFLGQNCTSPKSMTDDTVVSEEVSQPDKLANSLLWKISGKNAKESYLYGTIHIINDEDFFYPKGTMAAIEATEKMIFEIDMAEMGDMSKAMELMQKVFMDDNKTLKDVMSAEDYEVVEAHFKKIGLPLMFMQRIKPMFLTVFASGDINPGDLQSGKVKSYEMEFAKIAEEKNLGTGGLETIDFQISVFDDIPDESQATMLVEAIKSSDTGSDQFKEMVEIYKNQDISGMQDLMKGDETIEEYEDILLVKRNKNWIPLMIEMMAVQPTFFAVGAGHLGGETGVINLLKEEGYKVTPVISI